MLPQTPRRLGRGLTPPSPTPPIQVRLSTQKQKSAPMCVFTVNPIFHFATTYTLLERPKTSDMV